MDMDEDLVEEIPKHLLRRREPRSGGLLSSVEAVLLSLLDDSGSIPSEEKLQDFMAICTRIDKVSETVFITTLCTNLRTCSSYVFLKSRLLCE